MSAPARPLRADAARNLDRILVAAREVFGERGLEAGMDDVARRAGVGKGTLYRRFPSKDDLVWAVAQATFAELLADTGVAAGEPDAGDGLELFVRRALELQAEHRAFFESTSEWFAGTDRTRELHEQFLAVVTPLLRRAQAAGRIRSDLEPGDVPIVLHMLGSVTQPTPKGDLSSQARERYVALALDALRPAGPRAPLPGGAYDPFG